MPVLCQGDRRFKAFLLVPEFLMLFVDVMIPSYWCQCQCQWVLLLMLVCSLMMIQSEMRVDLLCAVMVMILVCCLTVLFV